MYVRCWASAIPANLPVEVQLRSSTERVELKVELLDDGRYVVQYVALLSGYYRLEVTSCGKPLRGTPHAVLVSSLAS